jgi:hypothetical protein
VVRKASRFVKWPLISVPVTVMSATCPDSTWVMNSLNFSGLSFFWIWAKCQARKMTTSNDIHNMTVLNVAFTVSALQGLPKHDPTLVTILRRG